MKKMLIIFLLLSFLMAGMAISKDLVGIKSNVVKVPNIPKVPVAVKVPNVVGLPEPQARAVLEGIGLEEDERRPKTSPDECDSDRGNKGLVVRQDPVAGTMVDSHSSVKLAWCN